VHPRHRERDAQPVGEGQGGQAPLHQLARRVGEGLVAPGAELDLAGDQLAREPLAQAVVGRLDHLLEAVGEAEAGGIEELVLLLEPDGEVGRGLEPLAGTAQDAAIAVAVCHPRRA
jgi:hypothetical protein